MNSSQRRVWAVVLWVRANKVHVTAVLQVDKNYGG
jgi:hypothetical protein